ncbi:hypothetical protein Ccrd_017106 [Cynara cardunculus var. scolymus]|uniref:Uncharacterized protein n=1 Tax=Cynara cardunculus var. scolymus TaxID=59895 RepID=A0A103Y8P4_CYNCS|nr:hypothetical protein Ccrd_017106 [Cynara cardunculus var. scolymus]
MLSSKSSKWLHRLRSSRGFPDSDHINLEHFLSNSLHKIDPQTSTDSAPLDKRPRLEKRDDGEAIQGRDIINNVLSELFQMGEFQDSSRIKRKKNCRKQQCPRICVLSTNSDAQDVPVQKDKDSSPLLPLTLTNRRKVKELNQELKVTERVEEEEEKGYWDLSAYSQTEVTVIDTSVPSWKFEKMLYRRKNVWKVGDKKGKGLMSGDRKKRKELMNENGDVEKKKLKHCSSSSKSGDVEEGGLKKKKKKRLKACNSSKYVENDEAIVRSKSTQGHEQCKTLVAVHDKKQDNCSQVQEKRHVMSYHT